MSFLDYRVGADVFCKRKNNNPETYRKIGFNVDNSDLSKREWNELMVAFDLKDKLHHLV